MARKPLIRCSNLPYHVTSRANNQRWFTIPIADVWEICQRCLKEAYEKHKVEVISFVLMSNHYHLIIRTPDSNLDSFMYEFNKRLALSLKFSTGNINHLLGGRYKWCLIQSNTYLGNCYRYVYQNPKRAMLSERCENYPYSTLHYIVNNKNFAIPIFDQMGFKDGYVLNWINENIKEEELLYLKKNLKKAQFRELKSESKKQKSLVAPFYLFKKQKAPNSWGLLLFF